MSYTALMRMFQPTRPVRGAAGKEYILTKEQKVSTHAPRTGRGKLPYLAALRTSSFNPRAPYGARQGQPDTP